jgi:putative ATP-dependent endonuclease of OLD family
MVFDAAVLAGAHDKIYDGTTTQDDVLEEAKISFAELRAASHEDDETTAINIYRLFTSQKASKAIAAQYLAAAIDIEAASDGFDSAAFEACLPTYLVDAIKYACGKGSAPLLADEAQPVAAAAEQ